MGLRADRQYCGLRWFSTWGPLTIPLTSFRPYLDHFYGIGYSSTRWLSCDVHNEQPVTGPRKTIRRDGTYERLSGIQYCRSVTQFQNAQSVSTSRPKNRGALGSELTVDRRGNISLRIEQDY